MDRSEITELKRRTVIKSLIWRLIGVVWTWIGAYFIILLVPPTMKTAAKIATLIVIYHHSTRMVMYYFYERIWSTISWGKFNAGSGRYQPLSFRDKIIWVLGSLSMLGLIFFLLLYVTPMIKK